MAILYFDASAFVKLVVEEDGSDLASRLWDGGDAVLSSRLSYPEVRAALAASHRNHDLSAADLAAAESDWEQFWAAVRPVELTATVQHRAGDLAREQALRGADAVHLAGALTVPPHEIIVVVWDRRLHAAAVATRLAVAPAELPEQI